LAIQFPDNTSQITAATSSLWAPQNSTDESLAGGNVGIGTIKTTTAALTVMNGNVGIGTWVPSQMLDVQGTIRTKEFAMTTDLPAFGYVLTAQDTNGNAVWSTTGSVGAGPLPIPTTFYLPNKGNVGIGTTLTTTSALTVMNGNVGIGTWVPGSSLSVVGGNVGIGTTIAPTALYVADHDHARLDNSRQ